MAGEIRMSASINDALGSSSTASLSFNVASDQATLRAIGNKQTITTSNTTISLTGITTPRAIIIVNTDPSNYLEVGPDNSGTLVKIARLYPGEGCMIPLIPSVVIKAIANTASCVISYLIVET